jgi:hypothetical protein
MNHIGCLMVSMPTLMAVDHGIESRSGHNDYKINICCCSKHSALRSKSKDRLVKNQNNVSEWSNMSIRELFFKWATTITIQFSMFLSSTDRTLSSSSHQNMFLPWYSWKIPHLEFIYTFILTGYEGNSTCIVPQGQ